MLKQLGIEWMKIKNYRTFWILLGIMILSVPALNYLIFRLSNDMFATGKNGQTPFGHPFAFPDVWKTVAWNSTWLFILPAILIITVVTNEFTYKTHRQNIIDGWSRGCFIGVKLISLFLLSILGTVILWLTVLGFGLLANKVPAGTSVWKNSRFLGFYFIQLLSYSMIAFVLSVLIKRAGLAIGVFLIYILIEKVLVAIVLNVFKVDLVEFLPKESASQLLPFPYAPIGDPVVWEHRLPWYLAMAGFYLVLYCVVTSRYFLKSDL
jgi:ABC-2 type transport system permease protein